MKTWKILFIIIVLTTFHSNSYAQRISDPSLESNLCVKRYDIIIDAYYGFPYLMGSYVKQVLADSFGITGARNLNHLGGKFEYMVWDKIGLGVEYTYAALTLTYQGSSGKFYTAGVSKQRFLAKFNYHFATSLRLDPYLTSGIGYSNSKVFTNEPGNAGESITFIPVAFRTGIGMRYFFTEMVGVNAEVGLGGPLIQGGISFKF